MSALAAPQPYLARTETELIEAVRSGDDTAFAELYSRYAGRIVGYVEGIVGDHGRAEDIAQDVFISALRAMRSEDRAIAFKPWIFEIARNASIDEFRRLKRCPEVAIDAEQASDRHVGPAATTPPPDAYVERRQQLDDLRGAFSGLSEGQHKVLVLRELEGRSYSQIAERLGMSVPRVESTLFRARRRLGQEYDEIASGRRCERVQQLIEADGAESLRLLGLRERRRFARHVAHCQPCRRYAHATGVDEDLLQVPSIARKIAGLLPLPILRWWRAKAPRSLRSLHRAMQSADPGVVAGAGQTAVAVVATAIVAGSGIAGGLGSAAKVAPSAYRMPAAQVQATAVRLGPSRALAGQPGSASRKAAAPRHRATPTPKSGPKPRVSPSRSPSNPATSGGSPTLPRVLTPPSPSSLPGTLQHVLPPSLPAGPLVRSAEHRLGSLVHKTTRVLKKLTNPLGLKVP